MISINIILDKRKAKKDGSYPINFQISFKRKTTTISTKISICEVHRDGLKKVVKSSHPPFESRFMNSLANFLET